MLLNLMLEIVTKAAPPGYLKTCNMIKDVQFFRHFLRCCMKTEAHRTKNFPDYDYIHACTLSFSDNAVNVTGSSINGPPGKDDSIFRRHTSG